MSDFEQFRRDFMQKIADAMGISYEHLVADSRAVESRELEEARAWWRKFYQLDRFYAAEWNAALANAIYAMAIWTIESYCGYDPQKLLPDLRYTDEWWQAEWQSILPPREPTFEHKMAVVTLAGLDFSGIEARVLATLADKRVRCIVLDIESAGDEIAGNPQLDLYRQAMLLAPVEKKVAPKAPPSYLRHDPTKNVRRRRRK